MQKKTYCLESNKVKQEIKICQISDIHYENKKLLEDAIKNGFIM